MSSLWQLVTHLQISNLHAFEFAVCVQERKILSARIRLWLSQQIEFFGRRLFTRNNSMFWGDVRNWSFNLTPRKQLLFPKQSLKTLRTFPLLVSWEGLALARIGARAGRGGARERPGEGLCSVWVRQLRHLTLRVAYPAISMFVVGFLALSLPRPSDVCVFVLAWNSRELFRICVKPHVARQVRSQVFGLVTRRLCHCDIVPFLHDSMWNSLFIRQ